MDRIQAFENDTFFRHRQNGTYEKGIGTLEL